MPECFQKGLFGWKQGRKSGEIIIEQQYLRRGSGWMSGPTKYQTLKQKIAVCFSYQTFSPSQKNISYAVGHGQVVPMTRDSGYHTGAVVLLDHPSVAKSLLMQV